MAGYIAQPTLLIAASSPSCDCSWRSSSYVGRHLPTVPSAAKRRTRLVARVAGAPPSVTAAADENIERTPLSTLSSGDPSDVDARSESLILLEWPQISARVARYASTDIGRQHLLGDRKALLVPEVQEESEQLLALTRDAYDLEYRLAKPLALTGIHDIAIDTRMAAKGKVLQGRELLSIAETLAAARNVRRHIEAAAAGELDVDDRDSGPFGSAHARHANMEDTESEDMTDRLKVFQELVSAFRTWPDVESEIRRSINDFGAVEDSCDPKLAGLRQGIKEVSSTIRSQLAQIMAANPDAIQDRIVTSRYDRFVIPVKVSHKSVFRKGTVHDVSASGSTAFIEPDSVRKLNDKMRQLAAAENARVKVVLRRLSEEFVAQIADDAEHLTEVLAVIDAATARAKASHALGGVDVVFDNSQPLRIRGARHPLLSWHAIDEVNSERAEQKSETKKDSEDEQEASWKKRVVPSSYVLEPSVKCVCVTGPNTGGKTISLKTLGVVILMAKAGLFVPSDTADDRLVQLLNSDSEKKRLRRVRPGKKDTATSSVKQAADSQDSLRMPYFDNVLADIGDDQSLVQSLSTFSGHIERIKRILARTTKNSVVLFDEIGSGTDPAEGAALGIALLRFLAGVGGEPRAALTFATTHHGELKSLKYDDDPEIASMFENASVEFDDERMAPTFRLMWGIPGRSNALAIASRLGLSSAIISSAEKMLTGGDEKGNRVDISKIIAELERERRASEQAKEDAAAALREADAIRDELKKKLAVLEMDEKKIRAEKKLELEQQLLSAKEEIRGVIKDMQIAGSSSKAAGEASTRIDELSMNANASFGLENALAGGASGKPVKIDSIEVGALVAVPRLGKDLLQVVEVNVGRKEATVLVGKMRAKIKVREIAAVSAVQQKRDAPGGGRANQSRGLAAAKRRDSGQRKGSRGPAIRTSGNTVDIRGQAVDEAESNVDIGISRALMNGTMWVIHGHGTGRLRQGIREFLKQHPMVKGYVYCERVSGCTGSCVGKQQR